MTRTLLVLVFGLGCAGAASDDAGRADTDSGTDSGVGDDGATPTTDGGLDDAGSPPPFDGLLADDMGELDPSTGEDGLFAGGDARNNATCYDDLDNNDDGVIDCDVSSCQSLNACCIGSASCCETPTPVVDLGCGATADTCIPGSTVFGTPEPFVDEGMLALGGDDRFDSGVLGSERFDLSTESAVIDVTFQHAQCESGFCLESAAVGWTQQTEMSASEHVDPIVALHSARGWVQIRVGDVVVDRIAVENASELYTLTLRTDGTGTVTRGETVREFTYSPVDGARVIAWGHSRNPSATLEPGESRARIASLSVSRALCENPQAWSTRRMPSLPDLGDVRRVSTAQASETWVLAVTEEGDEFMFREMGEELEALHAPDVDPLKPGEAERIVDAALVAEDGVVRLYAIIEHEEVATLVGADWNMSNTSWDLSITPEALSLPLNVTGLSLLQHRGHLILVGETASGLELYIRQPGGTWVTVESDLNAATMGASHPSLIVHGNAYELHYAHRVGARWRVGLAASDELISWRSVERDALQAGDDFDRVGARAPAALSHPNSIRLYYVGMDGVSQRLGVTNRRAADNGMFPR